MASNSYRKSDSSARSNRRKRVHVGTGTASRKASEHAYADPGGGGRGGSKRVPNNGRKPNRGPKRTKGKAQVTSLTPKQAERLRRRTQHRRRLLLRVGTIVVSVALLAGAWTALANSTFLEIEDIEVSGNSHLSAAAVLDRARVPEGSTLLSIDEDEIEERLAADAWIASAEISRSFPSKLRIRVEERTAVALVDTGMTFWAIDGSGRILTESQPDTGTALPAIRDVPDFVAEPGSVTGSAALANAVRILTGISPDLLAAVRVVNAPSVNETGLVTGDSIEIMIGEAARLDEKSAVVTNILAERRTEVVFIDVRSVERPISRGLNQ